VTITGIVDPDEPLLLPLPGPAPGPLPELLELSATELTAVILRLTLLPAGISTVTVSPTFASD
jgi:hypothetical protein